MRVSRIQVSPTGHDRAASPTAQGSSRSQPVGLPTRCPRTSRLCAPSSNAAQDSRCCCCRCSPRRRADGGAALASGCRRNQSPSPRRCHPARIFLQTKPLRATAPTASGRSCAGHLPWGRSPIPGDVLRTAKTKESTRSANHSTGCCAPARSAGDGSAQRRRVGRGVLDRSSGTQIGLRREFR